ncbi:MAG: MFS transporter [Planctomycetes bacterium]|nr:MFS transporter [Planctomycetota bacterium]
MALTAALLGWMFDGLEMGLFPLVARPALRDLGVSDATIGTSLSWIIAVFLVGAAAGGLLFGWLGDRIGRVRAMVWSVLVYAIFSGLCGFAQAPLDLAVLRFVAALGMGGEWSLGVALVMEIWPGTSRPLLAGLIGAAANVGFFLIGLLGLGLASVIDGLAEALRACGLSEGAVQHLVGADKSGWRILMILGAAPALLTFFIRLFVPESERWKEAAARTAKPRVADIFAPGLARKTLLGTALGAIALLGTWGSVQWLPSWADKLSEQLPGARAWTQIYSSLGAIAGTVLAAYIADFLTRRATYFLITLASIAVCGYLFWAPLWAPWQYGGGFLFMVGLTGCVTASFYGWLPLYLPELFPTRVRATGQGFAFNTGRVLAACGTLAGGQILNSFGGDYAAMCRVISLVYFLGLVVIWLCPETKGKPLPE